MATTTTSSSLQFTLARKAPTARRASVAVRAQAQQPQPSISRREASLAALAAVTALVSAPAPANAFLGLGDDGGEKYAAATGSLIKDVTDALALDTSDPAREKLMGKVRKDSVEWVSRYRRDPKFSGRPSYSNLYSGVNALDGQLNSFGLTSNVPKKRLERIEKELVDAARQLERGR